MSFWSKHAIFEKNSIVLVIGILIVIAIGGLVEIVPLFYLKNTIEKVDGVRPYTPLELAGRNIYVREGCYVCHSQMIRPLRDEVERYGHYSLAAESMYDKPFQWGSKRTGPDLARIGGKYSDDWHREHFKNPRSVVPGSIMLLSVSVWSGNVTDITPETRDFFHWASALIALPAAAYAGRPFFASAWRALRSRAVNMDVPISLGVILALAMSLVETANHAEHAYFDSALMLLFFLLVGRTLDHAMRRKTRAVAGNLAALKADTAHRFMGDELVSVPVAVLKAGDRLLVKPGERVPADGTVLRGNSEIDESIVTGETARRRIGPGNTVYAGCTNYSGALTLQVTAAGGTSLIDEIEKLLDKAAGAKSRTMRLADRAARIYAPVVHLTAALTFIGWLVAGASIHAGADDAQFQPGTDGRCAGRLGR